MSHELNVQFSYTLQTTADQDKEENTFYTLCLFFWGEGIKRYMNRWYIVGTIEVARCTSSEQNVNWMRYLHVNKCLHVRQMKFQEKINQLDISLLHSQVEYGLITFNFLRKKERFCRVKLKRGYGQVHNETVNIKREVLLSVSCQQKCKNEFPAYEPGKWPWMNAHRTYCNTALQSLEL